MKRRNIITILILTVIIGLLAWPKIFPAADEKNAPAQGGKKNMPVKVTVFVAGKKQAGKKLEVSGSVLAGEEVELKSETQGRIVKIYFDEGSEVKKGMLLLKINDSDLQAQLKKAISNKKLKEEVEKRNKQLLTKGAISQEQYDLSATELSAAGADAELIQENIRKTEMYAPFDGLIGLRYVSEGSFVSGVSRIASLQQINKVKVEFAVPEKYAGRLAKGDHISFTVEGQNHTYTAEIYAIEPKIDPETRNVLMRAVCDNANRKLLPGSFARVQIVLPAVAGSLSVPTQAIVPVLKGQKVFLVRGDSVVEQLVKAGVRTESEIEITEGLNEGDSIAVTGIMYLKQGTKVKVGR